MSMRRVFTTFIPVSPSRPVPWIAAGGFFLFAIPCLTPRHVPAPSRLAFAGSTSKPVEWVWMCLGRDWVRRLSLRHRGSTQAFRSTTRLDHPVRHFVVDTTGKGPQRAPRADLDAGEPFGGRRARGIGWMPHRCRIRSADRLQLLRPRANVPIPIRTGG